MAGGVCDALYLLTLAHEYSPRRYSLDGGGDEVLRLPVTSALVQTQTGPFLLDTGLNAALFRPAAEAAAIYPFGDPEFPTDGDPLLDALARCGVGPGDLAGVAMSHLHIDHAGGLRHLIDGPPVRVQRRELDFALERAGVKEAYWRSDTTVRGSTGDRSTVDTVLAPGLVALATPGTRRGTCRSVSACAGRGPGCWPWTPSTCRRGSTPTCRWAGPPTLPTGRCGVRPMIGWWLSRTRRTRSSSRGTVR